MSNKYTRRSFLEGITTATLSAMGIGMLLPKAGLVHNEGISSGAYELPDGATVLFQGDSITDAGRDRENMNANDPGALGNGYAFLAAAQMRHSLATKNLTCYNKGISGNKVYQLDDRWEEDCLDLQPDLISILIGVNDYWHTLTNNYDGTVEVYERDFRALLDRTRKALPGIQLIIGEPFVVKEGSAVDDQWFPEFPRYRESAREIAEDVGAAFIPYQQVFDEASKNVDPTYWTADGVHPTLAGSQLMAHAWMETFKRM